MARVLFVASTLLACCYVGATAMTQDVYPGEALGKHMVGEFSPAYAVCAPHNVNKQFALNDDNATILVAIKSPG